MKQDHYLIQEASESDLGKIADFFKRQDFALRDEHLVRWKYFLNPAGPPRILMVTDTNNYPLGILTFIPREFGTPSGQTIVLMQAVDAFFSRELRGKGMYRKLIDYSRTRISTPIYTFPNKIAENAERKAGWTIYSEVDYWYFPIEMGRRWCGRAGAAFVRLSNLTTRVYAYLRLGRSRDDIRVARVERFQRGFATPTNKACGLRSRDYLNWRFIDNPFREFRCYEFVEADKCIGYCVITRRDRMSELYDFVSLTHPKKCLRAIIEVCRRESAEYLFCRAVGLDLSGLGFIKLRSHGNLVTYGLPDYHWSLMACDCDWD